MCATSGMGSVDDELTAILHSHHNPTNASSVSGGVGGSSSSSLGCRAAASSRAGRGVFRDGQLPFSSSSERAAMLGPGTSRPYISDSGKPTMTLQTLNPFQEQGGQSFPPASPMLKNNNNTSNKQRQGLWSTSERNFMNGRNNGGELEMDPRLQQVVDYPSALLDQNPAPMPVDPYRGSGGLARYHSAPSSFLACLADFQQDGALSSFFSDADLPPLNASDSSIENMETEQSSSSLFDNKFDNKFLLNPRKIDRIGNPQLGTGGGGGGGSLVSQKSLQSVYKHSMEILHENPSGPPQMSSSPQISSSSQMPSSMDMSGSLGIPSSMGLPQQQPGQQQINLGSLAGGMNFSCGLGSSFVGGASSGTLGSLPNSNRSNGLLRQSSSPAGLLAQLSIDVQSQLAKNERQSISSPLAHSPEDSLSGGTSEENAGTGPGTPGLMSSLDVGVWEDAANSYMNSWGNDTFAARKRFRDNMDLGEMIASSEAPHGRGSLENGPAPGSLTRHMSLPTPKTKNVVLPDDILQSVPCRIRAKRGCATHPRSIAERVRRTRISERMRKLQELVPNMDKQQTNTADMLDEAVEYVKQLQRQVQELTESQAKCNGSCHQDRKKSTS